MLEFSYYFLIILLINNVKADKNDTNCDKLGVLIYEDLGCTPTYHPSNSCPSKFICNMTSEDVNANQCQVNGKTYKLDETIDETFVSRTCNFHCSCSNNSQKATVVCAEGDCPEYEGLQLTPGCYWKYSLDECCSTGQICPEPANNITTKCTVDGKEYKEGELFYPEDSCVVCVCQKGFENGKYTEPNCRRIACGLQLYRQEKIDNFCAPMYSNEMRCCPRDWVCSDGNEKIIKQTNNSRKDSTSDSCKFGGKILKIDEYFERKFEERDREMKKIRCECIIPPLLTCTEQK